MVSGLNTAVNLHVYESFINSFTVRILAVAGVNVSCVFCTVIKRVHISQMSDFIVIFHVSANFTAISVARLLQKQFIY